MASGSWAGWIDKVAGLCSPKPKPAAELGVTELLSERLVLLITALGAAEVSMGLSTSHRRGRCGRRRGQRRRGLNAALHHLCPPTSPQVGFAITVLVLVTDNLVDTARE